LNLLQALLLGFLQGATEFLPVSSSGHLVLAEHLMSVPAAERIALAAALHGGTAVAVVVYFRRQLAGIIAGLFSPAGERRAESRRVVLFIAAGCLPAGLAGLALRGRAEELFASPVLAGAMLLVTGGLLFATRFARAPERPLGWREVLLVGLAQMFALLPGLSRSGTTIAVAVLLGVGRSRAFEFSFLLSVPLVLAAAVVEMAGIDYRAVAPVGLALGVPLAFVVGLGALALLRHSVDRRRLHWFAVYCWLAGAAVLVLVR